MIKYVSMYEITKMMFEGIDDFEREINYQEWLDKNNSMEKIIMDEVNKKISVEIDKKILESATIELQKKINDLHFERIERERQLDKNYLDLPLNIVRTYFGNIRKCENEDEGEDDIVFSLHTAVNSNTGKISIQYVGEDDTFLSRKEIIKALKIENKLGKYKYQ